MFEGCFSSSGECNVDNGFMNSCCDNGLLLIASHFIIFHDVILVLFVEAGLGCWSSCLFCLNLSNVRSNYFAKVVFFIIVWSLVDEQNSLGSTRIKDSELQKFLHSLRVILKLLFPQGDLTWHLLQANAASGMAVHDDCKLKFLELKAKRTYRFIVYKIEEKQKQVVVEKLGEPTQSYEDFTASLPADECRYAVYDFDFVTEENCQKSRIFFIAW